MAHIAKEGLASFLGNNKYPILTGKRNLHCGLEGDHQCWFHLWWRQSLNYENTMHCSLLCQLWVWRAISFSWIISEHHRMHPLLPSNTPTCWVPIKPWWGLTLCKYCLGWSHSPQDQCGLSVVLFSFLARHLFCFVFVLCIFLKTWVCKTKITALFYWQGSW